MIIEQWVRLGRFGDSIPHRVRISMQAETVQSLLFSSLGNTPCRPYSSAVLVEPLAGQGEWGWESTWYPP